MSGTEDSPHQMDVLLDFGDHQWPINNERFKMQRSEEKNYENTTNEGPSSGALEPGRQTKATENKFRLKPMILVAGGIIAKTF